MKIVKKVNRVRRHARVRAKISGTAEVPRMSVYRSNAYVFVQMIDDMSGKTIASLSTKSIKTGTKTEKSVQVGKAVAEATLALGVKRAVFDKGGYKYHGRVAAVAAAAREAGLTI
jgi:large subunit ribosomal protein L18